MPRIIDLPGGDALTGDELLPVWQGDESTGQTVQVTAQAVADLAAGGVKDYVFTLTQSGTDAPVATEIINTLGVAITWTREGTGAYRGRYSDGEPFPVGLTAVVAGELYDPINDRSIVLASESTDRLNPKTGSLDGTPADDMLDGTRVFWVRVYPAP